MYYYVPVKSCESSSLEYYKLLALLMVHHTVTSRPTWLKNKNMTNARRYRLSVPKNSIASEELLLKSCRPSGGGPCF